MTKKFTLSTDKDHKYSCTFSLTELLRERLEDGERTLLHSMKEGESSTYTFESGQSVKYQRLS